YLVLYAYYCYINNILIVIENNAHNETILERNRIFNILEQKFNTNTEMWPLKQTVFFI
ncbi:MAG: hypothetical protein ACJA2M_002342, partial [Polaribacter sp.]